MHFLLEPILLNAPSVGVDASIIASFVREGIMGTVAVLFIGLYLKERAAHDLSRKEHATDVVRASEKSAAEVRRLHDERIQATNALGAEYTEQTRELLEQMHALRESHAERERAYQVSIEYFAKSEVEAVEELGRIADTLRRAYGSHRDR